ncbi:peptidase M50 [Clostridium bornimense]|uniref:Peptidase M50 n=1 Tax=Clostridium bornimense TaxID=1216932 RepID=W6RSZ6_9CLOT|nr:site-2 protease family protein [Clostridium bornimense]CDM67368.1 peptidase M50 [Clostridium bornimense]
MLDSARELIITVLAVLIAISMHELSHGYVSYKLGDPTPKEDGRLSLNPFAHLDIMGTLCLIFFNFGWAKPVKVNPYYYKNHKLGMVLVAIAGPIMNFIIAFLSIMGVGIIIKISDGQLGNISYNIYVFLQYLALINIGLGTFNLIPVPPLDGSKVLGAIIPEDKYFSYMKFEKYGYIALMILLFIGVLDVPLGYVREFIINGMMGLVSFILGM